MRRPSILLVLLLAACSSSDPKVLTDEGSQALGSGDAKHAVECFEDALARMEPRNPDFLRASMGRFQALARLEPTRAKNEFLAFQAAHSSEVRDTDFQVVVGELLKRGSLTPALELAEAVKRAYPESQVSAQIVNAVGDAAKKANDPTTLDKTKGLGYSGDD